MKRAMLVLLAGMMTVVLAACKGKGTTDDVSAKSAGESYTISYNQNNQNTTGIPDYQFLKGDISALLNYEARLYADIKLTLNDDKTYELVADTYTMEGGERIKVGASKGIGMVCMVTAEGTYEDNGDGTVTTSAATRASYELETDIY